MKSSSVQGLLIAVIAVVCVVVVLAIHGVVSGRRIDPENQCINNLRLIDSAKNQWALENKKTNGIVTWEEIRSYLGHGTNAEMPKCPHGGAYIIGSIGEPPRCSIGGSGHTLPPN